jgi:putative peptidoglycan lipid II flippase
LIGLILIGAVSYLVSLFVLGVRARDLKAATD